MRLLSQERRDEQLVKKTLPAMFPSTAQHKRHHGTTLTIMKRVRRFWSASLSLLVFIGSTHAQSDLEIQLLRYKHFLSTFAVSLDTSLTLLRGGAWDEGRNVHNGDLIPLPSIQPSNNANDVQLQVVVTDNRLFRSSRKFDYSYCPDNNFTSSVAFQEEESSSSSSKGTTTITSSTLGQIGRHKLCITTSSMLGLRKDTLIVNWWIVPGDDETPGSAPVAAVPVPAPSPPTAPSASSAELDGAARPDGTAAVLVVGELRQWHKISLVFFGPMTSEDATPNPFTDYRLDVVFSQVVGGATNELLKQQQKLTVPGYYAADGDAANTGANKGSQWHCHFAPPSTGTWTWKAFFVTGPNVATEDRPVNATTAIATKGKPTAFDGTNGTLTIQPTDKTGRDLRAKGLLRQVPGKHHWQFAGTGEWFLKVGTDSPENFLAYDDFDNTPNYRGYRKSWSNHIRDFVEGDPTWDGSHGKGIIGAINYLSSQRMRAFSFLVNNIGGDDQNVFPFVSKTERTRFDVSKTAQWEIVFEHANRKGLFLHFKTQEEESDQFLDDGALGNQRKLFYRELIARFGHHLALNWNLGEESTNTDEQRKEFADWIKALDPYKHPIVVHTFPDEQYAVYAPLYGYKTIDGASIQTSASSVFEDTLFAVTASSVANRSWVVTNDEQGSSGMGVKPDRVDSTHFDIRHQVLWGNIMAGGAGVEYYFGYSYENSDLTCENFRSRAIMWAQSRHAVDFFANNRVPFQDMSNENNRLLSVNAITQDDDTTNESNWCLVGPIAIVVYLPSGGSDEINLAGWEAVSKNSTSLEVEAVVSIRWFDPRNGGLLQTGSIPAVQIPVSPQTLSPVVVSLGDAPYQPNQDWAVLLLRCTVGC